MMSNKKKEIREKFRNAVFTRDSFTCRACNRNDISVDRLDAHHIHPRVLMPNGGYGISLCEICHIKAEALLNYVQYGISCENIDDIEDKYLPNELYKLIGSSKELALEASKKLK